MTGRNPRRVQQPMPPTTRGHRVTHVSGGPVICSCGWQTSATVRSPEAGRQIALHHLANPGQGVAS